MSKIYLDEMRFKSYINNNLEKSISLLKEIMNIAKSLDIPYDFDYKNYLKNLDDSVKSNLDVIYNLHEKIKGDCKQYNNINDDVNNRVGGIENYSISLRQSAIK